PRLAFDLELGAAISPSLAGDIAATCSGSCSKLALGGLAVLRGGYELGMGIGFSVDAGYLGLKETLAGRAATLTPRGLSPDAGTVDDALTLQAFVGGASAFLHTAGSWPVLFRLGGGVALGGVSDTRSGAFTTTLQTAPPTAYDVGPLRESQRLVYAYV